MKRLICVLVCLVSIAFSPLTASAADQKPLQCLVGPVKGTYGGTPWSVYSCGDDTSLLFVAMTGSPAAPFYFVIYQKDGKYQYDGEGTGSKAATDAAYIDLRLLSSADIARLVAETKLFSAETAKTAPPAGDTSRAGLIGSWRYTDAHGYYIEITYRADGTFSGTLSAPGAPIWIYAGTWTLDGSDINSVYTSSNDSRIQPGTKDTDTIVEMTKDCITTTSIAGSTEKMCRAH